MKKNILILLSVFFMNAPLMAAGVLRNFDFTIPTLGSYTAGDKVAITITAIDDSGVMLTTYTGSVTLTATTGNNTVYPPATGAFIGGEWKGVIELRGAAEQLTMTAADALGATGTCSSIEPLVGAYVKPLVVLPGMLYAPGTYNPAIPTLAVGYTGFAVSQTAGAPFFVTVVAVDKWKNRLSTPNKTVTISTTGTPLSVTPATKNMNDLDALGMFVFDLTLWPTSAESTGITATDDGSASDNKNLYVNTNNEYYVKAQVMDLEIVAGEYLTITVTVSHTIGGAGTPDFTGPIDIKAIHNDGTDAQVLSPAQISFDASNNGVGTVYAQYTKNELIRIKPSYTQGVYTIPAGSHYVSSTVTVYSKPPATFSFTAAQDRLKKGETTILTAIVKDVYANNVSDTAVNISADAGALNTTTAFTNAAGLAQFIFTAPMENVKTTVSAAVNSIAGVTHTVEIFSSVSELAAKKVINQPNPFVPGKENTKINYYLDEDSLVIFSMYNSFGELVWSKKCGKGEAGGRQGGNTVEWNGAADKGFTVGAGIYILKISVEDTVQKYVMERRIAVKK